MKRIFIRGLWGIYDNSHRFLARRKYTDKWIQRTINCNFNPEYKTYVFGKENQKHLKTQGIDSILIDKNPEYFDGIKECHRTKLEVMKYAMEEDGYDEIVWFDWDVIPYKFLPYDFWDITGQKEAIQACLQQYKNKRAGHRSGKIDLRKCPNGGCIYVRDKKLVSKIITKWEEKPNMSMEPALAKTIDDISDGWQGKEYYWNNFEFDFCNLHRGSVFQDRIPTNNECMIHYQGGLGRGEKIKTEE